MLVTGVGGNVGQGILKALAVSGLASWVVGVDLLGAAAGLYRVDRGYRVPAASAPEFLDAFCAIMVDERIDVVLVAADAETVHLARLRRSIEERTGAQVLVADAELVELCHDKWLTSRWSATANFPHPATVLADDVEGVRRLFAESDGRLVIKPRRGYGSRGVVTVCSEAEALAAAAALGGDGIAQHYVGAEDGEYTGAVLCDRSGVPLVALVMWRELNSGTSYRTYPVADPALDAAVRRWGASLGAAGPVNFQFRLTTDGPVCFEINPRFSGTTGLRHLFGFNDVALALRHFILGEVVEQPAMRRGVVMRYWDEIFVPDVSWEDISQVQSVIDGIPAIPRLGG
ncbi:Carbamoyl phosphate synthase [Magnetospirillum sp. LM-5]|uniref:ATP-grasp domain-containing protein n=1 Tax=Magnetospirillum sp. LM-5 TaxID=2681466 RepID=UPI00137CA03A|nr:ATP-grasp domain-containing protein [Magnetospirillum sp. LM-5]CAA7618722.1 Carbamoyl phosphate synthase [Magnetospirillum sp. LM-5]